MQQGHQGHGGMSRDMMRRHYMMFGLNMILSTIIMYLVLPESREEPVGMPLLPTARRPFLMTSLGGSFECWDCHSPLIARGNRIAAGLGDLAQLARLIPRLLK
jgi:hypothetical protein